MFLYARQPERVTLRAHCDDKSIVAQLKSLSVRRGGTGNFLFFGIDVGTDRFVVVYSFACNPDRLDDASKFNCADCGAGQERSEEEVISWTDYHDIVVAYVNPLNKTESGESGPEDCKVGAALSTGGRFHRPYFSRCFATCRPMRGSLR